MINKLIAIAAIVMAPSLASAQATGGTSGSSTGGTGGGQGASTGGSAASNPPRTEQQRRHDSLVTQMRNQHADTGNVQQFNGALSDTTDTTRKDTTRSDTTMMNRSDTSGMNRTDTSGMNRTDTSMMGHRADTSMNRTDTTMNRDTSQRRLHPESTATDTGTTTTESHGAIANPNRSAMRGGRGASMGLTTDQVKELQQAINNSGCHAGPVDGVLGRETREGIACVRQEKGVQGDHLNDVLSALGLGFTASPNAKVHAPRKGKMNRGDSSMTRSDTTTMPSAYRSDTTTTPTMDTTRSADSSMATDTTRSMDTTRAPDTTMSRDTSSESPPSTTNPSDSTMNPMNPMHPTDTTLNHPDTSSFRHDTSGVRR